MATAANDADTWPVPGWQTVAIRSNRHSRLTPPSRSQHWCSAAIRYTWSSASASTPRHFPEYGSDPTSRCAILPHSQLAGGSGSSSQSHWVSAPGS